MPHTSAVATNQPSLRPPQPEAFRSFSEGLRHFHKYQETDRGEELQAAEKAFAEAAEADPGFLIARFHHAVALAHLREHDRAIEILQDLARWNLPFQTEVLYNLSYAHFKKYDLPSLEKAESLLKETEQLSEKNKKQFLLLLARSLRVLLYAVIGGREARTPDNFEERKKKYLPEAAEIGEHLLQDRRISALSSSEKNDVLLELYNGLGVAYMRLGENAQLLGKNQEEMWKKAEDSLRAALQIQPTNTSVLQNLGTLRRLQGDSFRKQGDTNKARLCYVESRDFYFKSLSINGLDQFPHFSVSLISVRLADWPTAEKYLASSRSQKGSVRKELFDKLAAAIDTKNPDVLPSE